jgi:hypothetical protein
MIEHGYIHLHTLYTLVAVLYAVHCPTILSIRQHSTISGLMIEHGTQSIIIRAANAVFAHSNIGRTCECVLSHFLSETA